MLGGNNELASRIYKVSVQNQSGQVINLTTSRTITVRNGGEIKEYRIILVFVRSISEKLWDKVKEVSDITDHQVSYGRGIH